MTSTIPLQEAETLANVVASADWNGRRYLNVPGAAYKLYWKNDRVYFKLGKGRSSSEAEQAAKAVLGCSITDRYSKCAAYVVIEG